MNYYLVDYENVKVHGLDGISKLTENDNVYIFYSQNADSITFGLHKRMNESKAKIFYQKVEVGGKNALDFQLSSFLGYLICQNQDETSNYFIVTKDKGFSYLELYWKHKKVNIKLVVDVSLKDANKEQDELKQQIEKIVKDKEIISTLVQFIKQYKTKQGINNALMKKYPSKDNKKASEIYSQIKPLLSDKKG